MSDLEKLQLEEKLLTTQLALGREIVARVQLEIAEVQRRLTIKAEEIKEAGSATES